MVQFVTWLLISMFLSGASVICGLKTKEAWDEWHQKPNSIGIANIMNQQNIGSLNGDFVNGDKLVIENQTNVNASGAVPTDDNTKIDVAKLKINRAFEDFNKAINEVASNFPKESNKIANLFNLHNVLGSGEHIQKQMDLSISTKKKLDQEYEGLKRTIEDILVEILNKTSLQSAGVEFNDEQKRLDEARKRCEALYPSLNDNPKSWETKALNEVRLTKDFDVANSPKK